MPSQTRRPALHLLFGAAALRMAFACTTGCQSAAPALTTQELEGKQLYSVRCAHCHEENDLALTKVPPDLHGVFKSSSLPGGAPTNETEVRHVILSGKGMMPAFNGRFTDAQMAALLAYLHTGLR